MPYANVDDPDSCITNENVDGDDCDPDPCERGTCHDLFHSYHCLCDPNWSGATCDKPKGSTPAPPPGQCADGTYRSGDDTAGFCERCSGCPPGRAEHTACTPTTDTYCEDCPSGRYNDGSWIEGGCHDCSTCCQGWLLVHGGGCQPDRDTQCSSCPPDQYGGQDKNTEGTIRTTCLLLF